MVPTTKLTAREELLLSAPLSLWGSLNFENARNADREGLQSIPSTFIVNCGAYFAVARRLVLGGEITNLFNVQYEWWKDYPAPRIGFNVTAKLNFQ
jgi:outer membrane receptor protein involved in Fe transport